MPSSARRWVRAQDVVWLLLFSALALVSWRPVPEEIATLLALALLQIAEPRIRWFSTRRGTVISILLKLALCWALLGWTGGISTSYWVILLLPVLSAATSLNLQGALAVTLLACVAYLSFTLFIDWSRYELTQQAFAELGLRVVFLPVVAFLTHRLAEENRIAAQRYQVAASQLDAAKNNLRAAEAAVRRSERLAALGQLTAGLAHELRNPLGTMRASAEMLSNSIPPENEVGRELAGFISSEVDRTNSLITRFLEFARPVRLRLQNTDLTQVVDAAINELARRNPPLPVSVHRNYSLDTPQIPADVELIGRVVYNLLVNAAQATPPGGTVTVKTRAVDGFAELSVIDRGSGIERKHLESIFNPFFTTKPDGVGLGLAIVSKIVDEHGGRVSVDSEPGAGSVFRVYLPVTSQVTESDAPVSGGRNAEAQNELS
jgi:signal transduction histidine kinase